MITDLIKTYGEFYDAIIYEIRLKSMKMSKANLEVDFYAYNKITEDYEKFTIYFNDIVSLTMNYQEAMFVPSGILIEITDEILFDFLPIHNFDSFEEDPHSNFKLKCKSVTYKVI